MEVQRVGRSRIIVPSAGDSVGPDPDPPSSSAPAGSDVRVFQPSAPRGPASSPPPDPGAVGRTFCNCSWHGSEIQQGLQLSGDAARFRARR